MTREGYELRMLLDHGCVDVFQPDAAVTCGIEWLRHFAVEVERAGLAFSPHTWGNAVSLVANAHLAAGSVAAPLLEYPFDPPEWTAERRDFILTAPVEPDGEGWLVLGGAPGLGIELDEERLAFTRTDSAAYS
jgi:L-alanine-DL-glutamate epimerase-like enolase superfamily enzyme